MNQPTILFLFNVPAELALNNYPDVFVTVKSTLGENGETYFKFLDLGTNLVTRVAHWLKLWALVNKICEQKWAEINSNAQVLGDLTVHENGAVNESHAVDFANGLS